MKRHSYLGPDSVVYFKNAQGYCIIAPDASHPTPPGFERHVADTAPDVESLWKKLDAQERDKVQRMNEADFKRREEHLKEWRRNMWSNYKDSRNQAEKDFIIAGMKAIDNKLDKMNRVSVYGIAFMQEYSKPIPPSPEKKVVLTDAS